MRATAIQPGRTYVSRTGDTRRRVLAIHPGLHGPHLMFWQRLKSCCEVRTVLLQQFARWAGKEVAA